MSRVLRIGISTCPNDTFAFHGLLERKVTEHGLALAFELHDVQELNSRFAGGAFDAAKLSFAQALHLGRDAVVLPSGSALGFGVGPVLLAARGRTQPSEKGHGRPARVLLPGEGTTATLLYRLFHENDGEREQTVFSRIIPELETGRADFGVCIHEGRFTYEEHGLRLVEDLGEVWERAADAPLPLGGIVARRRLGDGTLQLLQKAVRASIDYGLAHREEALQTMRRHAQELQDDVLWKHVDLYVNEWTCDLGEPGRRALAELDRRARKAGLIAPSEEELRVLEE